MPIDFLINAHRLLQSLEGLHHVGHCPGTQYISPCERGNRSLPHTNHVTGRWLREKEMQRREEQLLQDYTQGHGKYMVSTSCPLHYNVCLHLVSPEDPANEFETFQCQHVVNTYHSGSKDTAPASPALPNLSFKNTARQHGQFLFSQSLPHTVHDFSALLQLLQCFQVD